MKPNPLNEKQTHFMKPRHLNEKQAHFIQSKLLPFVKSVGDGFVMVRLEGVLKQGQYDENDKVVIEFAINKMKENLYETESP